MKKIILGLLLCASVSLFSQVKNDVPTSVEEYNYMTKGYKIQLSSGLDVKKGYKVENITAFKTALYEFDFKSFVREKDNTSAGMIMVATSRMWGNVYYLAVPVNNPDLMADFNSKVAEWDKDMVTAYSDASSRLMSVLYSLYWGNQIK
jgi:hypothetical protein